MNTISKDHIKITRIEFDNLTRDKQFVFGPWMQDWDSEYGAPYIPTKNRTVWGQLFDGRKVYAESATST